MNRIKPKVLVITTLVTTAVYLIWRTFFTLPFGHGFWTMVCAVILLLAEVTGMFEQIIHFLGIANRFEPKRPVVKEEDYPTVDVYIATYNEPAELLYKTVNGCVNMDYPDKEKVKIFLCDDGDREEVSRLAKKFGIGYLRRDTHEGAKAGNLNHAMANTDGELIVTFDADMIPMSDFLLATIPYFIPDLMERERLLKEEGEEAAKKRKGKIGFIQTPQNFYNLDLFQYNLYAEKHIPNEQDYFYRDIELGKNSTNSVIYGGSNTVISREALNDIGGFVTNVITEDFATGMLIQSKGYSCYAVDEIHASGLSPEDLISLIKQRKRWARGCIQTGRKLHILFKKGLNLKQKFAYWSSITYWYSSIKRFIYMIAPVMYGVFGILLIETTPIELLIFWLPMYMINSVTLKRLSGNIRTMRWTNIYETILFPLLLKEVLLETVGISEAKFSVTKKGGRKEEQFNYIKLAIPHMIFVALTIYGIINSFHIIFTTGNVAVLFLVFWLLLNLYNLTMSILFMLGRKVNRHYERFVMDEKIQIRYKNKTVDALVNDLSEGGCSIVLKELSYLPPREKAFITIYNERYKVESEGYIVYAEAVEDGWKYAYYFSVTDEENYRNLLQIIHDRVPPCTQKIDLNYGFFENLRLNIINRNKKHYPYKRKLPRILLNKMFITEDKKTVKIVDFNFEYVVLSMESPKKEITRNSSMKIQVTENLMLNLLFERTFKSRKDMNEVRYLYRVENVEEVAESKEIQEFIKGSPLRMIKKRHLEGEFNELNYM